MPAVKRSKPAAALPGPGRLRRFLLLELPGWFILAVSVAYASTVAVGNRGTVFQVLLISAAIAWLGGGRSSNLVLGSVLFGWSLGTMGFFNLLAMPSIGIFLLPVTVYAAIVLVLIQLTGSWRSRSAAVAGILLAILAQLAGLAAVGAS